MKDFLSNLRKEHFSLLISVGAVAAAGLIIFLFLKGDRLSDEGVEGGEERCLQENEIAEYEIENNRSEGGESFVVIRVKNSDTGEIITEFKETILQPGHYHPVELHDCGVYFVKGFNHDPSTSKQEEGFRSELWSFNYEGQGVTTFLISELTEGEYFLYLSRDFRVDSQEELAVFAQSYPGQEDYALVVKDLDTKDDLFVLPVRELYSKNNRFIGSIGFLEWTHDSRYFWFSMFEGAYVNGWVRVDLSGWSYELFEAPEGVLGGYPLNINTGWVPLIPGAFWTGAVEFDEEVKREREAMGHTADLYLYNVFTKERILVEDTDAPIWRGLNGVWLDDSTFAYDLPSGERREFTVPDKE